MIVNCRVDTCLHWRRWGCGRFPRGPRFALGPHGLHCLTPASVRVPEAIEAAFAEAWARWDGAAGANA